MNNYEQTIGLRYQKGRIDKTIKIIRTCSFKYIYIYIYFLKLVIFSVVGEGGDKVKKILEGNNGLCVIIGEYVILGEGLVGQQTTKL